MAEHAPEETPQMERKVEEIKIAHGTYFDSKPLDLRQVKLNGKKALITGITGQDGSYLAEFLLLKVR